MLRSKKFEWVSIHVSSCKLIKVIKMSPEFELIMMSRSSTNLTASTLHVVWQPLGIVYLWLAIVK